MKENKINLYLISVLLFMLILPIVSIVVEVFSADVDFSVLLVGKWLIFWAIGVRLLIAGIRQITKPSFTAHQIFRITGNDSFPIIRELGFANICIGIIAMLSVFRPEWRMPAAIAGGLYFGLAGMMHLIKKPESRNEAIALVSDLYIFIIMLVYCSVAIS
ncbi:DUF6790 family protein [Pedobacter hiemivivus]|uniref:DoxX family protein n=1 Tax=Pedobacter hiemivivus TaxID=2530454 RepID=A0A4R0NDQ3_9SPHI|nr:DUF6790 family protein [Pedobacter hiemivivus]TCC98521.1 hypothetical protein EZ444_04350 [Pedobacter hiemivivus]